MPTIKVNTSKLSSYESEMQSVLSRVNSINSQFSSVSRNLDWDIKAASNISSRMSAVERELSAESRGISGMKNYLGTARIKYDSVESRNSGKRLKNEVTGSGSKARVSKNTKKTTKAVNKSLNGKKLGNVKVADKDKQTQSISGEKKESAFSKWFKNTISKGLIAGTVLSGKDIVSTFKTGFKDMDIPKGIKTATDLYKNASGVIKNSIKIGKAISATNKTITTQKNLINAYGVTAREVGRAKQVINNAKSETIKKFIGIDDSLSAAAQSANVFLKNNVVKQSWGARFADQFTDSVKTSTKGLKKPAGIVSSALTVVVNGVSNYDEWHSGKISKSRAVAETVTESVIDIGTGIAVGAAVTAGLAATVGSAPVLAVAAVSTGVIMGADALTKVITKKVTGEEKGLTETVSDFVLDTAGNAIKKKIKEAKTVFNVGSKVVKAVCGG